MSAAARGERYCRGRLKRVIDAVAAGLGLALLSPLLLLVAATVLLTSGRPVLFRQERVGLHGRPFTILKFRTMRERPERGLAITGSGDDRITPVGRFLRALKLDELPQLVNVLWGDMSLVGPRPEVPRYVAAYTPEQRRVLSARPGLTDPATILFVNEEDLLGAVPPETRETYYVREVLPRKLSLNLEYIEHAGVLYDLRLVLGTLLDLVRPRRPGPA